MEARKNSGSGYWNLQKQTSTSYVKKSHFSCLWRKKNQLTPASTTSDQEERRRTTRQIAMDKKMQENNDDLAKALAKSQVKERELRDEIAQLQADHLELISRLQSFREEQDLRASSAEDNKKAMIDKLIQVTQIISDLTMICMGCSLEKRLCNPSMRQEQITTSKRGANLQGEKITQYPVSERTEDLSTSNESQDLNQVNDVNEDFRHQLTSSRAIPQSEPPANIVDDEKDEVNPQSESIITSPKLSTVVGKETMQVENPIPNDCGENDPRLTVIANDQRPEIQSSSVSDERIQMYPVVVAVGSTMLGMDNENCNRNPVDASDSMMCNLKTRRKSIHDNSTNQLSRVDQRLPKRKQKFDCGDQNKHERPRRKKARKMRKQNASSWIGDKENLMPQDTREVISKSGYSHGSMERQNLYCSPLKHLTNILRSPLQTKSPLCKRTRMRKDVVSYAEPSLVKKMRRGDPYSDSSLFSSPHIGKRKRAKTKNRCKPLTDIENSIMEEEQA